MLPTLTELDAVEADPAELEALREAWLADARFESRMVDLYAARWRTEVDTFLAASWEFGLEPEEDYAFLRAVGQEPLRLVAHVVAEDLPYTTIVTADWTMADPLRARVVPLGRTRAAPGWGPAHYQDGRPAAGVLATNGLWWRYVSPLFNYNRRRTAALLDLLVCEDILSRPVVLSSADALEVEDAESSVLTDRACVTCHATVEPVAATLFGFLLADTQSAAEMSQYHPEREPDGPLSLGVQPAWFGTPVDGLDGLGRAIASDGRFVDCAVETVASGLLGRPVDAADAALLREARDRFVEDDLRLKSAIRAVTDHPSYRAGASTPAAAAERRAVETTRRALVGDQLRTVLGGLDGFVWARGGADELDSDTNGFRILAGGADGEIVSSPARTPGVTHAAVVRRAAQVSARWVVDHELVQRDLEPDWLGRVTVDTRPGESAFTAQIEELVWRLHAVRASAGEVEAWAALWSDAHALTGDPAEAWATVLGALLRDPAFLTF